MSDLNLQRLEKHMQAFEGLVTIDEIEKILKVIMEALAEDKEMTHKEKEEYMAMCKAKMEEHMMSMRQMSEEMMAEVSDKVARIKEGSDGEDGYTPVKGEDYFTDIEIRQFKKDVTPVKGVDYFDGKDGKDAVSDTGIQIREKVQALDEGNRWEIEDVNGLKKELDDIKTSVKSSAGGVTNARIQQAFKYLLKTEAPVGDIDGVNTTYTLAQPIFAIFSMSLNGEVIAQLPNYTISGKSFTFSTALPAAYSGKDFEVKYI